MVKQWSQKHARNHAEPIQTYKEESSNNATNKKNCTIECGHYAKYGHMEENCWKKSGDVAAMSCKHTNYANKYGCEGWKGPLFMISRTANSMAVSTSKYQNVWFIT